MKRAAAAGRILTVLVSALLALAGLVAAFYSGNEANRLRTFFEAEKKVLVQETLDFDPRQNPPGDAHGSQRKEKGGH